MFLSALWPNGLPDGGHLVLTVKREDRMAPEFYSDVEETAARAAEVGQKYDVYIGMAAQPRLAKGRGTTETALAIPGLWLDLDYEKGFGDLAWVHKFLSALPYKPSLLVGSGGGVHAYWLFREYLEITPEDQSAAGLEMGWLQYCREVARLKMRAELDAVSDLARVMRVPGTRNFKRGADKAADVVLLEVSEG